MIIFIIIGLIEKLQILKFSYFYVLLQSVLYRDEGYVGWNRFFSNFIFLVNFKKPIFSFPLMLTWNFFYFKERFFAQLPKIISIELGFEFYSGAPLKIQCFFSIFFLIKEIYRKKNSIFLIYSAYSLIRTLTYPNSFNHKKLQKKLNIKQ